MASHALAAFVAGLYALVFILLLIVSIGDDKHVLNLQAWFSWHVVYVLLMVSDVSPLVPTLQARRWHTFVRQVTSLVAACQSLGFGVWACVEWTQTSDDKLAFEPRNFYGLAVAVLFAQAAVAVLGFLVVLNSPKPVVRERTFAGTTAVKL